jgi:predicted DNA-binding transcriptional regulator YafY
VPRTQALLPAEIKPQILHTIYQALLEKKQIRAKYLRRNGDKYKYDVIHPLGLVFRHNAIYLVTTIKDYGDLKQFSLHRFQSCSLIDKKPIQMKNFNLDDYIASGAFDYTDSDRDFKLTAFFSKDAAIHLHEAPLSTDQTITSKRDGRIQVSATVKDTSQLRWWLLGFGRNVEIVKPKALRDEFIENLNQLNKIYSNK